MKVKIYRKLGFLSWNSRAKVVRHLLRKPLLQSGKRDYDIVRLEKKKLSFIYGNKKATSLKKLEFISKQISGRKKEPAWSVLMSLLERRLDVVLFRLNFVDTFESGRQLIVHKKVYVNEIEVTIPSYTVQYGDIISIDKDTFVLLCTKKILDLKLKEEKLSLSKNDLYGSSISLSNRRFNEPSNEINIQSRDNLLMGVHERTIIRNKNRIVRKQTIIPLDNSRPKQFRSNSKDWQKKYVHSFFTRNSYDCRRKKPLHFEINYLLGKAICLYNPQIVCLPIPLNIPYLFSKSYLNYYKN